jgi:hypothetical protein
MIENGIVEVKKKKETILMGWVQYIISKVSLSLAFYFALAILINYDIEIKGWLIRIKFRD